MTLSGTATYESVPNPNGGLVYTSTSIKPVRGATVEAVDATSSAQLAVTTTDDSGAYALTVPANSTVFVRVRAQLTRTAPGASWDVSVRDNTRASGLYSMQSSAFSSGAVASTHDLRAATGWDGSRYAGQRVAAPFAILDTVYTAMQKVLSVAPASAFPVLRVFWSPDNAPAGGSVAAGQIGTTFFINRSTGREIYVLGKEDVDTDEFDAPVIAHEWGHYYQSSFSRDDSTGGDHTGDDRVDRRLAFSEGWGNAWSGIALNRRNYVDSKGARQAGGGSLDLTTGPSTNPGWYRETSIQAIFWNLNQQVGFGPIHNTMTSLPFRSGAAVTSIHPFASAFGVVAPESRSALAGLLTAQKISAVANDPYGDQEGNAGGLPAVPDVLPMYGAAMTVPVVTTACVSNVAGSDNKLGSFAYLRFTAPANRDYQFVVGGGPAGAVPQFDIYRGGLIPRSSGKVGLGVGDYVLAVSDSANSGTKTCFNVTIQ
ncbi:hypothetical protein [Variovorax sp. GB1P17]|uniref:hypothetical protein n=1 Tax=Variovorax sp. GB1P17 TaxID=3443740 RepID=UPI003F45369E